VKDGVDMNGNRLGRPRWLATLASAALIAAVATCTQGDASAASGTATGALSSLGAGRDSAQVLALLGGVRNAACPLPEVATGGQPGVSDLQALAEAGFRTILDLRLPEEPRGFDEPAVARAAGLRYRAVPIGHDGVPDSTFDTFRALMADSASRPVMVHCASGNRVGPVMMAWLVLDRGWDEARALAVAKQGGLRSPSLEAAAYDYIRRHRPLTHRPERTQTGPARGAEPRPGPGR
jgi:protein tyrosine phosphatase (PTP) superfamily phosphohydrolase (DUF442 family)